MSLVTRVSQANQSELSREDPLEPDAHEAEESTPARSPADTALTVRQATSRDEEALAAFGAERASTVFQRPEWARAVARVFRHERVDLVAHRNEELVGVLPLMRCRSLFGGSHLISMPYGVYGGPVAVDSSAQRGLVDEALVLAKKLGVGRLELRSEDPLEHAGLVASDRYVTFIKDLPDDPEEVIKSMKKDERRLVRRAVDKHELELDEGPWFLEDLARLFHSSKQRLGSPGLPPAWFRALSEELGENAPIHIVRRRGEVLAASMCFVDGGDLRMYYIGTTAEANRAYSTTSFMIAALQRWAIERGLKRFDLGRSRSDAGAVKFKTNQGFASQPLHYSYGLVRSRELPSFTPSNPKTALLRKTWTRLPAWLCTRLSDRLSRFLP